MKNTKLLIVGVSTLLITWMFFGLMVYLLSDMTYKEAMTCNAVIGLNLFIGWIPLILVLDDVHNHKTKNF
jgi:hypothetical protein